MPEDTTRRLLKVFGVSVTECEDTLATLVEAFRDAPRGDPGVATALEAYGKAASDLGSRWAEVSRLILDYHARAQQAVEAYLRTRGESA